jgi:Cu(I)/Ag(I) efflux system membrane protein CusA/SilA
VLSSYGLNIADVQSVVSGLVRGETVGYTLEGLQRFPISVRYPRELPSCVNRSQIYGSSRS